MSSKQANEYFPEQELWLCHSELFSSLCFSLKKLSNALFDPDEDLEYNKISIQLRIEIAKLRYLPWQGSLDFFEKINLKERERLKRQYGYEIVKLVDQADLLLNEWVSGSSILIQNFRKKFFESIDKFGIEHLRIACRTSDKSLFQKILSDRVTLEDHHFITGIESYRATENFEILFRIGSFRIEGMQSVTPAILTAPRYRKLIRYCWDRAMDESDIARDPVAHDVDYLNLIPSRTYSLNDGSCVTDPVYIDTTDLDQQLLSWRLGDATVKNETVNSLCFTLPGNQAVFFRRGHSQLVWKIHQGTKNVCFLNARELLIGDYWIDSEVEVDLGKTEIDPNDFPLTQVWKNALKECYRKQPSKCVSDMRLAGIALKDLHKAAKTWSEFSRYRVNTPLKVNDFQALIEQVLPSEIWAGVPLSGYDNPIWEQAWSEVRNYRSQMIEDGQLSNQIVNEQLRVELSKALQAYSEVFSSIEESIPYTLPANTGLVGKVVLRKILSVKGRYSVPEEILSKVMDISHAEQFTADQVD